VIVNAGEALSSSGARTDWRLFVEGFRPSPELSAVLDHELSEARVAAEEADVYLDPMWGVDVVDAGNTVDGDSWVWCYYGGPADPWRLLPGPLADEDSTVFSIGLHDDSTMVGGTFRADCRFAAGVVGWFWTSWVEESDAQPDDLGVDFDPGDGSALLRRVDAAVSWLATYCDHDCPLCVDWALRIDIADPTPFDVVPRALNRLWRPCAKHGTPGSFVVEAAGDEWEWNGKAWSPTHP
jgi:hypothetical protein